MYRPQAGDHRVAGFVLDEGPRRGTGVACNRRPFCELIAKNGD